LLEKGTNVEEAYQHNWKEFETGFWEKEISVGRLRYPRSAIFLNHWLIARAGEEVVAREVFDRFKRFADHEAGVSMSTLLGQVHDAAGAYRGFITVASALAGPIDRLGLFGYRTGVLESEVIKPLVLCLLDPEEPPIPKDQFVKALDVVESWMVRRMLVRATTKNYNQVVAEVVALVRRSRRASAGDEIGRYLAGQSSGRLRMVLEAIEDYQRGWKNGEAGLGDERVARAKLAIEHVMPRKWHAHWPLQDGTRDEAERDRIIHTLGNLTLLTGKLNSKVSNGPWLGNGGKRQALEAHDVLLLNRELLRTAGDQWTDEAVRVRTKRLTDVIIEIWPVPPGHRSGFSPDRGPSPRKKLHLSDLIVGGVLEPGMALFPRRKKFNERVATLLPDGQLEIGGVAFSSPSEAASIITGHPTNGWWFFLVDQASRRSLTAVRRDYTNAMAVDVEDDEPDDDADEDEG
jgi:hypothetical protein